MAVRENIDGEDGLTQAQTQCLYRLERCEENAFFRRTDGQVFLGKLSKSKVTFNFYNVMLVAGEVPQCGWKLHVSVDSAHVERAWELIVRRLLLWPIARLFKVYCPDREFSIPESLPGRDFTIFIRDLDMDAAGMEDIKRLIEQVEDDFRANNIHPNPTIALADKKIAGSQFFTYRNDREPGGEYVGQEEAIQVSQDSQGNTYPHNPYGYDDPLAGIRVFGPADFSSASGG